MLFYKLFPIVIHYYRLHKNDLNRPRPFNENIKKSKQFNRTSRPMKIRISDSQQKGILVVHWSSEYLCPCAFPIATPLVDRHIIDDELAGWH